MYYSNLTARMLLAELAIRLRLLSLDKEVVPLK